MNVLLLSIDEDTGEIEELIESAGYTLVDIVIQKRAFAHPRFFLGRGKIDDAVSSLSENDVRLVVVNGELNPSQHYNLERCFGVECIDRIGLILNIFAGRAHSREAKLQIQMARLQYEQPLLREWVHRAKASERPGFMAGGEYRIDVYYETNRKRMKRIREELRAIQRRGELRRSRRRREGYYSVAIAGYANAGKSSLLNALTGERVLVDGKIFSTLSTTTRALKEEKRILLTDTVGLISDIPIWMIEAFRSTLEDTFAADLILLLIDSSDSRGERERKLNAALDILVPSASPQKILPIWSKIDLLDRIYKEELELNDERLVHSALPTSALTGEGIDELIDTICGMLSYPWKVELRVAQNTEGHSLLSWLYNNTQVLSVDYGNDITVQLRCREGDMRRLEATGCVDILSTQSSNPLS